ncbi:MAG: DUF2178 domain-containing protein [Lachnospiraceae bacterium]|nr:DUF2178 domain-containing protein [Lachnospiraceae bacterium]
MKHKKIIWYAGYIVSLALVLLLCFTDFPFEINMAIGILFSVIFSVSHTQLLHLKMLGKDKDYRINIQDERNVSIKEKTGNITNMITVALLGCATVLFIALEYTVPAIILCGIILVQPIIMSLVSNAIEKKM